MDWSSVGSSAISSGIDLGGSYVQSELAKSRQHDAQQFSEDMFKARYQMTVADMKKAGLNPMLAYMQGGGNSPGSSAASASESSVGTRALQTYNLTSLNSAQVANVNKDTEVKDKQVGYTAALTEATQASAENTRHTYDLITEEIEKTQNEAKELKVRADKEGWEGASAIQYTRTQMKLEGLYEKQIALTGNQIAISNPQAEAARTTGAFAAHGRNISEGLAPLSDFVSPFRYGRTDHYLKGEKVPKGPNDY